MTQLEADPFHRLGQSTAIADEALLLYYLGDRELRVLIARVGGRAGGGTRTASIRQML
jgi:hypothetical protein